MVELTPEQRQAAQAQGRQFVAATDEQVATLSMQRRVFWMEGRAFLAVRSDGFLETVATLQALLDEATPGATAAEPAPAPVVPPEPVPSSAMPAEPAPPPVAAMPLPAGGARRPDAAAPASAPGPAPGRARHRAGAIAADARPTTGRPSPEVLASTARLVASYVRSNRVAIGDLDGLIRGIHRSVTTLLAARPR